MKMKSIIDFRYALDSLLVHIDQGYIHNYRHLKDKGHFFSLGNISALKVISYITFFSINPICEEVTYSFLYKFV